MRKHVTTSGKYKRWSLMQHLGIDEFLEHMIVTSRNAVVKLTRVPKKDRPEWLEANIVYYRTALKAYRTAKAINRRSIDAIIQRTASSSTGPNRILPGRGCEDSTKLGGECRDGIAVHQQTTSDVPA
jgi:hypothetical protein